jgi:hypothetical protein
MKRSLGAFALAVLLVLGSVAPVSAQQFPGNNNDRPVNTIESVRRAIDDMISQFADDYPNGENTSRNWQNSKKRSRKTPLGKRSSPRSAAKRSLRTRRSTTSNSSSFARTVSRRSATTS